MTLVDLKRNQKATIIELPKDEALAAQLLEQGFVPKSEISLAHIAPWNGPMAFRLDNTKITLGQQVAKQIKIDFIQ
ncbi:MAG: ferrous iron transport protein A [Colwellia sp.]|nr:ferrous iron transport protein A [Colwellia sp.]